MATCMAFQTLYAAGKVTTKQDEEKEYYWVNLFLHTYLKDKGWHFMSF